ncbi:MAG: glycosyltransferase family 4 protein [Haloarculaceae archaeon]
MRVAVVALETSHYRDTAGRRRIERVARLLADAGHDVTVYCAQWWTGPGQTREVDGVTYHAVTLAPATPSFYLQLASTLTRHRPDVIHVHPSPVGVVLAARAAGTLARAPLVVEWYGDEELPDTWAADRAVRVPDRINTPSELIRTEIRERGADGDRTVVVPESIDMDLVRETDPGEATDVVYAHRLDESANVESLLLGLAELREKGWSATVVGDGPQRAAYERQAADLRIDDRVAFVGACDRAERVAIYRSAHAFVQTAYRVCFPTELLWALAAGCVGIVEYQAESSAHELIETRERSFRVTNPQQLADAIVDSGEFERLTVDESLAAYDHEAVRERYVECYEDLRAAYGLLG